ncbi:MAG: COX15/CtaA family protein [Thermoproteota archaeon]|nr:COX15/CtaA family protein [Thermoproteota archaeon]
MEIQHSPSPKVAAGLSFCALALLYSVMLVGVYISSSNQGLSCTEWPLCPNGFGLPSEKYFFEHYHRVMVVIMAGFIFATALYSSKKFKPARKTAIIAAIVVSVQIVFGMLLVTTRLEPVLVATHLSTGILLFAMTLMTFLASYKLRRQ